jgi:hypothetical protein
MFIEMNHSLFPNWVDDKKSVMDVFEKHNQEVRETIPGHRLLVWQATEGWDPICAALGLPVPDEPFPYKNTTENWLKGED